MNDPFFIVGNSRSGTTLVSRILKNHPDIHVLNETHVFDEFAAEKQRFQDLKESEIFKMINSMLTIQRKDYYRKSEYEEFPEEACAILAAFRQHPDQTFGALNKLFFDHEAAKNGKSRSGDQTPRHVFNIDEIFLLYPEAKIIHMVRDPRAVLFSQKKKWTSGLRRKQPFFEIIRTFINYHPITMSILWGRAVNAGLKAASRYGPERVKTIFFEAFVMTPEDHTRNLCEFIGESFYPGMTEVDVELSASSENEGKKGVARSIAGQWKNKLSETEVYFCERYAGETMAKTGYTLTGAKPDKPHWAGYLAWLPLHLGISFLMNLTRMGNPIQYIAKRFF